MKKTIFLGISLIFFIVMGIASQTSARKVHCWDLNENYECDIEAEDMNNDGKCNVHDCETEEQCYAVPQTGQTDCYDIDGSIIDCAGTGQDGEYQYGTPCPEPRFTDNLDGTVTDNCTGLIWLKIADCGGTKTWADALTFANSLYDGWTGDGSGGDCGLSDGSLAGDWRLPNIKELVSLIHIGYYEPAVPNTSGLGKWSEEDPFTGVRSDFYWSSSTYAPVTTSAWHMFMYIGRANYGVKTSYIGYYAWPVRGGN
jgi:hypothetical protein